MRKISEPKEIMQQLVYGRIIGQANRGLCYALQEEPSKSLCDDLNIWRLLRFGKNGKLETCYFPPTGKGVWLQCCNEDMDDWFTKA